MNYTVKNGNYKGKIFIPSSKSDCQRALLIAALGTNYSILKNVGFSNDEQAMLHTIQALGATVKNENENTLIIGGNSLKTQYSTINCEESGLGLRLLTCIAALQSREITITGEGSLCKRQHLFFEEHFAQMGVHFSSNNGFLPFSVKGPLHSGNYVVDGGDSSQYISGLLIAFSQEEGKTVLKVENCKSKAYIDMTLHTLKQFGINITILEDGVYEIEGAQAVQPITYTIEGDWSSASYWLVAAALGVNVQIDGLSLASKQADKALLQALLTANCRVNTSSDGIVIDGAQRAAFEFDATHCPDLFPALTTLAVFTHGISKIKGVHRLANKESNRATALMSEFSKLGVEIFVENDELVVVGGTPLVANLVDAHIDHRIAMTLAIASIVGQLELTIEGAESVNKSYPDFWKHIESLQV